jgi:polyisoprenoid-binding protein YceI
MSLATNVPIRTYQGMEVPAAGTYTLDPSHTKIAFWVRHLMVAKVRGHFNAFSGTIVVAEDPLESTVHAEIQAASIDTGDPQRDAHLRSEDFLNAEDYPTLTYVSTGIRVADAGRFMVDGELTVRGVTRPVSIDAAFEGGLIDPFGNRRIAFEARTEIDREEFGLTWNQTLETGGVVVGKRVNVEIDVEAISPQPDT